MRTLLILAALLLASPATAGPYDVNINITRFPSHWYLDKGPRVLELAPYTPSASTAPSPSLAVPFHAKTNAEAEAEARAQARLCAPVRLVTDEGAVYHRPSECR
jgi:hypothetical protein